MVTQKMERVGKEKIKIEPGYLYFINPFDGMVWKRPLKERALGIHDNEVKVGTERIALEDGYLYFVSKAGYVSRRRNVSPVQLTNTTVPTKKGSKVGGLIVLALIFGFLILAYLATPHIDSGWATNFFTLLNAYRANQTPTAAQLTYCSNLTEFAQLRYSTQSQNYQIAGYGLSQDEGNVYGAAAPNINLAEDLFYSDSLSPKAYLDDILIPNESSHPCLLTGECINTSDYINGSIVHNLTSMKYYGYYIGQGQTYLVNATCTAAGLAPGTDIPQAYSEMGCNPTLVTKTWLVIETSDECV